MMRAGQALEHLVAMIREHLKDNPETKITLNAKLMNRSGNKREIDVFVRTKANGEDFGIAFECKDYNRKITEQVIDAFVTKIGDIPEIHKGIIVTTSGYTKGARKEAEAHKIGLHLIDELPLHEIIPRYKNYFARVLVIPQKNELIVHTIADLTNVTFDPEAKIKNVDDDTEVILYKEIFDSLYNIKSLCSLAAKFVEIGKKAYTTVATITPNRKIYIADIRGIKYEIDYFELPITVNVIMDECQISSQMRYAKLGGNNEVLVSEYGSNITDKMWVLVESEDSKDSIFLKDQGHYFTPDIIITGKSYKNE